MFNARTLARALSLAFGLATIPAAASVAPNSIEGARYCRSHATAVQVDACAGVRAVDYPEDDDGAADDAAEAAAEIKPVPRMFYLNRWGGVNACHLAATDTEVEYCAGEIEAPALDPSRFDCRKAEVLSEYQFCGKPLPRARRR